MKQTKKVLYLLVLLMLLISACSGPTNDSADQTTGNSAADVTGDSGEAATGDSGEAATGDSVEKVTLVDWGFTGDIQEGIFNKLQAQPFMQAHPEVTVELLGGTSNDAIAQIKAAQGVSPIDTMLLGESRYLQAMEEGWILPLTEEDIPNVANVYPNIQAHCSPGAVAWTVELIGLVYNPDLVPKPENWADLWNPEYKGLVGMAAPSSNAGFLFLMMVGQMFGENAGDLDAIWAKMDELEPFVVANNPEALSQLLETEEIGVAINWNTEASVSLSKGYNVEFVLPKPGGIAAIGCYAVLKDTAHPELAKEYVNIALGLDFQQGMSEAPFFFAPVHKDVVLSEEAAKILPSPDQYPDLITVDLEIALPIRESLTDEFIRKYGQ